MNRKRSVLILCVLILLFGAAYVIVNHHSTTAQSTQDTMSFAIPTPAEIQSVEISYAQDDAFCILRDGSGWLLESDANFPLDDSLCSELCAAVSALQAVREVEGGDRDAFGFDTPVCQILAIDADGTQYSYLLGNYNDYNGLYYLSCGEDSVYMLDAETAERFFIGAYDLIEADEAPNIDAQDVRSLSVQSASGTWQYTLERLDTDDDTTTYQVSGSLLDPDMPDFWYAADPDEALSIFKDATLLYLYSCVEYCADDDQTLASYGLLEPTAQATISYEQEAEDGQIRQYEFCYDFGSQTQDGYIYVRMQDSDMVFLAYYNEAAQFLSPDFQTLTDVDDE